MYSKTTLHALPRIAERWTFVYVEAARLERSDYAVVAERADGSIRLPVAQFVCILAGPGTTVTHAASTILAERGCALIWCGESGVRFYGHATPETHMVVHLEAQARAWADPLGRLAVAKQMFRMRFPEHAIDTVTSIEQLRGYEGNHMRSLYRSLAAQYDLAWSGKESDPDSTSWDTPLQQAIRVANSCLYGICHSAIVAVGMSPALGFVHTGNQRSFVWDVADLYKATITLPIAYQIAAQSPDSIPQRTRRACRDAFKELQILRTIVPDILRLFALPEPAVRYEELA
jgi:CRISP-associated protein Cas1